MITTDAISAAIRETVRGGGSRLNAAKHGLAGVGATLSGRDHELESRLEKWVAQIRPGTEEGLFALRQAVAETIRVEGCRQALAAAKELRKVRASTPEGWELDRKAAAARLAEGLQKRPESTVRQLEATKQGVEVLLAHWDRLGHGLDETKSWSEAELSTANDLLAVPLHLRASGSPFTPQPGVDEYAHRRKVAMQAVLRLEDLVKYTLGPVNELERAQAESGISFLASQEAALILRYERDAIRRHNKFLAIAKASRVVAEVDDIETDTFAERTSEIASGNEQDVATIESPPKLSRAERRQAARPAHRELRPMGKAPIVGIAPGRAQLARLLK